MSTAPYLSVVATARNDDHGGDLLHRMQLFVTSLVEQCERHALSAELVLVEWNPPSDRPPLAEVLEWPESEWCSVRIIRVPPEIHARFAHSDELPLFQMIAKNVGIRRARAPFVLATNIDIILSDDLVAHLARRSLKKGRLYRVDRHDVDGDVDGDLDHRLAACERQTIRISTIEGTTDLRTGELFAIYDELARLPWWVTAWLRPLLSIPRRVRAVTRAARSAPSTSAAVDGRDGDAPRLRDRWHAYTDSVRWERARVRLHTNACGDFTLMSRDDWFRVRAYPELEVFSMHLDGLLLYLAHYSGIREEHLPHPTYHLEHAHGFRPDAPAVDELNARIRAAGISSITSRQLMDWAMEMRRRGRPLEFNDDSWGLRDEDLPESLALDRGQQAVR